MPAPDYVLSTYIGYLKKFPDGFEPNHVEEEANEEVAKFCDWSGI